MLVQYFTLVFMGFSTVFGVALYIAFYCPIICLLNNTYSFLISKYVFSWKFDIK